MSDTTAIAISGGIDSLVAAHLLKEQGRKIIGIHFLTGYESVFPPEIENIADQLGITVKITDCSVPFKSEVVDYFIQTYLNGQTPNPCLKCNPCIKFGKVLDFAREMGASCIATGHYARTEKDSSNRFHLFRGADPIKEQSYFLAFLSQRQLASACFPLANMTKAEVREIANEKGLYPVTKKESQDICFVKGNAYGEFLAGQKEFEPGPIEDMHGRILGRHKGLHLFTIGQRRGINCPASEPYYVVRIDRKQNRLIVGFKDDLLSSECRVMKINWITRAPDSPVMVYTRVRYRHEAALSTLFPTDRHTAVVKFENPQSAITPGQGAVFYDGDEILGGGWICA